MAKKSATLSVTMELAIASWETKITLPSRPCHAAAMQIGAALHAALPKFALPAPITLTLAAAGTASMFVSYARLT